MIGIILAGGLGTRLYPLTIVQSKQLLPVFDKPMIYYPLATLMSSGIKKIILISSKEYIPTYKKLFSNGEDLGIEIKYLIQDKPEGIAQAFIISKPFIKKENVCLILGDNIFHGDSIETHMSIAIENLNNNFSTIFAYYVSNPNEYGVVEFDKINTPKNIIEKPKKNSTNYAVTGMYFYTNDVFQKVSLLVPSKRGELEITSLNNLYIHEKRLKCEKLDRGISWLDMGTFDSLLEASSLISSIEKRQGLKIGCLEEIAYKKKFINRKKFQEHIKKHKNKYGDYLKKFL